MYKLRLWICEMTVQGYWGRWWLGQGRQWNGQWEPIHPREELNWAKVITHGCSAFRDGGKTLFERHYVDARSVCMVCCWPLSMQRQSRRCHDKLGIRAIRVEICEEDVVVLSLLLSMIKVGSGSVFYTSGRRGANGFFGDNAIQIMS